MRNVTLLELFQAAPVQTTLLTAVPLALAVLQLANSVFNDLPFLVSVPFALVLVGYASLLIQHQFSRVRRRRIERESWAEA